VHKSGTYAQALQNECMEVWNVSIGKEKLLYYILFANLTPAVDMVTFDSAYNATTIPRHLKVFSFLYTFPNNITKYSHNSQCFIKCLGENADLVIELIKMKMFILS
jgi:hypothetical protein